MIQSSNKKIEWDVTKIKQRMFDLEVTRAKEDKTEAEIAYEKMYAHKEGFLPAKRNLYEALDTQDGYHRFG